MFSRSFISYEIGKLLFSLFFYFFFFCRTWKQIFAKLHENQITFIYIFLSTVPSAPPTCLLKMWTNIFLTRKVSSCLLSFSSSWLKCFHFFFRKGKIIFWPFAIKQEEIYRKKIGRWKRRVKVNNRPKKIKFGLL